MDFVLSMPYPESQVNNEIISSQTAQWGLANEIISSLSGKLLAGEPLPSEVIRQIYQKILPYDDQTIDKFIDDSLKARQENDVKEYEDEIKSKNQPEDQLQTDTTDSKQSVIDAAQQSIDSQKIGVEQEKINIDKMKNANEKAKLDREKNKEESFRRWKMKNEIGSIKKWKMLEATEGKTRLQEKIDNEILQVRQENLREGKFRGNHYFSSRNLDMGFPAEKLVELDKNRLKKLEETKEFSSEDRIAFNKTYYSEEVKYSFKENSEDSNNEE
jgi:hypothetical protein